MNSTLLESTDYHMLLQTTEWATKRLAILKRDGNKCVNCGSKRILQVHHKQYHTFKVNGERKLPWDYDDKYLVTLCDSCHGRGHRKFRIPVFNI